MERKIVEQGEGAHTISLPVQWIRQQQLKAGDSVHVTAVEAGLFVSGKGEPQKKEITITTTNQTERILRIQLHDLYRLGYDQITVQYKTGKQQEMIQQICDRFLLGFEVVADGDKQCVLENVAEPSKEKQRVLLRRMFRLLIQSCQLLHQELLCKRLAGIKEIQQWTEKLDRYDNFCRRSIAKQRFVEEQTYLYWTLYSSIHVMQRSILHLYKHCSGQKLLGKDIAKISQDICSIVEQFHTAFFMHDLVALENISETCMRVREQKIMALMGKTQSVVAVVHLAELLRFLSIATSPAIGILLAKR
jgi:phosphate uptake regulator